MIYPQRICFSLGLIGTAGLLFALGTQVFGGMRPCPWCIAQRVVLIVLIGVAFVGSAFPRLSRYGLLGVALAGLLGAGSALWQSQVASKSASCAMTLPDRWLSASGLDAAVPVLFEPLASCAESTATLLGAPYEAWSFVLFVLLTGWATQAWRLARRRSP